MNMKTWNTILAGTVCAMGLILADVPFLHAQDDGKGWVTIFDGKSLKGWKPSTDSPSSFSVENGLLKLSGNRAHLFYTGPEGNAEFRNFELKLQAKTMPNANSGVYLHTKYQEAGWPAAGYEAQVNTTHKDPKKTGSLYGVVNLWVEKEDERVDEPQESRFVRVDDKGFNLVVPEAPSRDGEWFEYHIIVKDKTITLKVDGEITVKFTEPEGWGGPNPRMRAQAVERDDRTAGARSGQHGVLQGHPAEGAGLGERGMSKLEGERSDRDPWAGPARNASQSDAGGCPCHARWWLWLNLLSLDAPLVALGVAVAVCRGVAGAPAGGDVPVPRRDGLADIRVRSPAGREAAGERGGDDGAACLLQTELGFVRSGGGGGCDRTGGGGTLLRAGGVVGTGGVPAGAGGVVFQAGVVVGRDREGPAGERDFLRIDFCAGGDAGAQFLQQPGDESVHGLGGGILPGVGAGPV